MLGAIRIPLRPAITQDSGSLLFAGPRLTWLCTVVAFLSACGATEPEPPLVYSLARVAGQPLPAPMDAARWSDGTLRVIEALEGRLTLFGDGSFKYEKLARRTVDGVPVEDLGWRRHSGVYERTDSTVIARFDGARDVLGRPSVYTVTYRVSDSGRVLRGTQAFGRVYEWVLVDPDRASVQGK
ncbi:MAG: hypothetical protein GTN78_03600 [Gemmatimonadales bacterium]|nr:hypothetical protein [Gemmatimonadales bacterium]NIQ99270.1 hypothetical protein [Gemmatimonadales bacterium]